MTKATVKEWIENQMSEDYTYKVRPGTVEVMADPQVSGTFAARFQDANRPGENVYLLFITGNQPAGEDGDVLSATLEEIEVEADEWPLKSGNLQFFI